MESKSISIHILQTLSCQNVIAEILSRLWHPINQIYVTSDGTLTLGTVIDPSEVFSMPNQFSISSSNELQYTTLTEPLTRYAELQGESKTWLDAIGQRNYGHPASALYKTDFVIEQQRRFGRRKVHDIYLDALRGGSRKGGDSAADEVGGRDGYCHWCYGAAVGAGMCLMLLGCGGALTYLLQR